MPVPGDLLADRYRVGSLLGAGGMATVHRGHDERLDRDVAIKVLLPNLAGDPVLARRFEREARAMAAVADPGLVAVFDVDAGDPAGGREPFVVMELCAGGSLQDRLTPGRPMPPDELVPILVAVANALAALHRAGLVHRDVKPSNVLFTADRVKLGDFGLARGGENAALRDLTEPGTAVGTLAYLAPERLHGDPGGPPADVYALGTIAHLGLTGSMPRPDGSIRDVVAASASAPPPVSAAAPSIGPAFDEPVGAALAVDPTQRPDALALASGLAAALGRWSRSGRPGALDEIVATATTAGRAPAEEPTTAVAMSLEPTAALAVPQELRTARPRPPARGAPARRAPAEARTSIASLAVLVILGAFAVVAALALLRACQAAPVLGPANASSGAPPRTASAAASPSASIASSSPSVAPSRSPTPIPTATPNPVLAALNRVDSAISAARGGPDGLKGKDANSLESMAARVRRDVADGKPATALRDARALDRRAQDLSDHLNETAAQRLTDATAALVDALGG